MKQITASLAYSQLQQNRKRTVITIVGIALSVAMMTAVFGFALSGIEAMRRLVGDEDIRAYSAVLYSFAAVLGSIIMVASVVVISNAFRISAAERTRQFGILKSVGATKKQIVRTVLYEAAFLSAIAIPAGLLIGLLVQWLGSSIGDALLAPMNKLIKNGLSIHMRFEFSLPILLLSVGVSLVTVLLSAWLPARKAAGIPAIEAIRMTQEIKVRTGKLRTSKLVSLLFGFEGTLAAKAIKRSRRSYRALVTALTISVVLFLVCGNLDAQLTLTMNQAYNNVDANTLTTYLGDRSGAEASRPLLSAAAAEEVTRALAAYPDTQVYGVGIDDNYNLSVDTPGLTAALLKTLEPGQTHVRVVLVTVDRAHYEALCRKAGVAAGSNILINSARSVYADSSTEFQPLQFSKQTLALENGDALLELPLHGQLSGADVPQEIAFVADGQLAVVVADAEARLYSWFAVSDDVQGFIAHATGTLEGFFPQPDGVSEAFSVTDVTAITDMTRSLTKLITVFLYGFVGMLSLIGLTSIISAIAANVRLRAREFAVLASTGMTQSGIRKMLALESVMSALKALLWGIPLGSAATYLTYLALTGKDSFGFVYAWPVVLEAALGVFLIALITTWYASFKLRGGSVMEVIRSSEGV